MTKEEDLAKLKFGVELRGFSKHTQAECYTKVKLFQNCSSAMPKEAKIAMLYFLKPILRCLELTGKLTTPKSGFFIL